MKPRRYAFRATILFSLFVLFSGQACPPSGDNAMPTPNPIPGPPGPAGPDATVAAGAGVNVDNGVVSLDTSFTDAIYWKQGGNTGTTAGTSFLGTTDDQPLELHVNGKRALRLDPSTNCPNLIGGSENNAIAAGVVAGTIAGGGPADPNDAANTSNSVFDDFGTIGGGSMNVAGSDDGDTTTQRFASVGGGSDNAAAAEFATVAGGEGNRVFDDHSTIAGGRDNWAGDDDGDGSAQDFATIGGGFDNEVLGTRSTIGGGANNHATGDRATIAGGAYNNADRYATVGGGQVNDATGFSSTIGGGTSNEASGEYSTIAGGRGNEVTAGDAVVSGGRNNRANGLVSMVPGGFQCWAEGFASFAAGYSARATHRGAFVWADTAGIPVPFSSTAEDQFLIRAAGGVGIGTNAPQGALHTQAPDDDSADLVLGGNDENDDNGLISSDPNLPSSDINFFSNGDLGFKLDSNDDESNAQFIVADGDEVPVFVVDESGKASAGSFRADDNLGGSDTPDAGRVYRDNVVYAWAQVLGDGTLTASYGCTVDPHVGGSGNYTVRFKRQLPNGVSAVVTPRSVNDPVIATVNANQSQATVATRLFVPGNGNFQLSDYGFYIQVVGRP